MIILKSDSDIDQLRAAGAMLQAIHRDIARKLRPGLSPVELLAVVDNLFRQRDLEPVFPVDLARGKRSCISCLISTNSRLGTPVAATADRFEAGEIVNVDVGCRCRGWCIEAAWPYHVGDATPESASLLEALSVTRDRLLESMAVGISWQEAAHGLRRTARECGYNLIPDIIGHGIGRELHEDPQLPTNLSDADVVEPLILQPGMVLAVEWGLTTGCGMLRPLENGGWESYDRTPCVHGEMTVAVTASGVENLTPVGIY